MRILSHELHTAGGRVEFAPQPIWVKSRNDILDEMLFFSTKRIKYRNKAAIVSARSTSLTQLGEIDNQPTASLGVFADPIRLRL